MRRRLLAILPFAFFGAVISVLVAWLLPDIGNDWGFDVRVTDEHRHWWHEHVPSQFGETPATAGEHSSLGAWMWGLGEKWVPGDSKGIATGGRYCIGFPWLAFKSESWSSWNGKWQETGVLHVGRRVVPWHPIWTGLVLDTAFFAALLVGILRAPLFFRGLSRLNHGKCAKCAYPIGNSDKCSECGTPLPKYARAGERLPPALQLWRHRRGTLLAILLVLGGLTTLLIALVAAATSPARDAQDVIENDPDDLAWLHDHCTAPSLDRLTDVSARSSPAVERMSMTLRDGIGSAGVVSEAHVSGRTLTYRYRAGWPLHALEGIDWAGMAELPQPDARVYSSADTLFIRRAGMPIALPLRPMWLGFAIDTLFYAALLGGYVWLRLKWQKKKTLSQALAAT